MPASGWNRRRCAMSALPCEGKEAQQRQGFVTAEYAGTGFMLIRRKVLEKMIAAYPETRYTSSHHTSLPSTSGNQYALFDCMIDQESGAYLSEDYTFCKRWRDTGGQIWLDTESTLTHIGAYDLPATPRCVSQANRSSRCACSLGSPGLRPRRRWWWPASHRACARQRRYRCAAFSAHPCRW